MLSPAERRAVAAQPMGYAELKHHSRQDCPAQGRDSYVPPPGDPAPCHLNEKTCTSFYNSTGMGRSINITYDWKHFMYEDYDRWLYNRQAPRHPSSARFSLAPCLCAKGAAEWVNAHRCSQMEPVSRQRNTMRTSRQAADTTHRLCPAFIAGVHGCRWTQEKSGPTYLFVSPGLHDCYHQPDQYEHHARRLRHLVEHLSMLQQTVVRTLWLRPLCNHWLVGCQGFSGWGLQMPMVQV